MAVAAVRTASARKLAFNSSCTLPKTQANVQKASLLHFWSDLDTPSHSCRSYPRYGRFLGADRHLQESAQFLDAGRRHRKACRASMGLHQADGKSKVGFVKYQGLGNDFLLVDNRDRSEPSLSPEQAAKLCDRNFGVGGDGVIFVLPGKDGSDYTMRIYNSDSSEPEMCGNGIRCMAKFVADLERTSEAKSYTISTGAGPIIPRLRGDGQVVVDMGPPILNAADIPTTLKPTREDGSVVAAPLEVDGLTWSVTCVSMGNPHCITFGCVGSEEGLRVAEIPLAHIGPLFERNPVFPARINTEFVEVVSRTRLKMRVWERGAGPTLACGTGACALLVAAVLEGRADRTCTVELPGGPLEIEWREADNHVYMTGPAEAVFEGVALLDD